MGTQELPCRILQLSDCTMMCILSYLDATALFNLSRTCLYFKNIVEDPQLWRYIEARKEQNSTKKVQYVCERVHDKTTHLLLKAETKYEGIVPKDYLLSWTRLEYLSVLALENQRLDGREINMSKLPKTLEELSLKKTHVKRGKLFFHGSYQTMRRLRVLILDECDWIDSNFFVSIAKYENLEILSIIKCMRLHLNIIPYFTVARHGCKKLKVIDCRFNTIGHDVLRTFGNLKPLLALYFQSMCSYEMDTGTPLMRCPYVTSECEDIISQNTIKNDSLEEFRHVLGDLVEELPNSLLYVHPYPECTCGYKEGFCEPATKRARPDTWPVDDYIEHQLSEKRFICRTHLRDLNSLPMDFKNFFYENQKKFYPDSSDNDSDSDDDGDCCMFGVGISQQMIVIKVRDVDEQGNLPEPEVIDIPPANNVINIAIITERAPESSRNAASAEPQPSTSRQEPGNSESPRKSTKRKAEDDRPDNQKRARSVGNSATSESSQENLNLPGPSRQNANAARNARGSHPSRVVSVRADINFVVGAPFNAGAGAEKQVKKSKLRRLSLRGYRQITDRALHNLRNLSLDLLDVTHTNVTKQGVETFLQLNPNCRVVHEDYCVCKPIIPC